MRNQDVKYYFGRLNLIAQYKNEKEDFITIGLTGGNEINIRDYKWGFYNIEKMESELGIFISGYLVKYNPKRDEEVVDPSMQKLTFEEIRDSVKAKSRFFLHVKSGLIAFHPISNQITVDQFTHNFAEIFMRAYDNFFVNAEIQIISERFKILEMLNKFSKINEININLFPSNPSLSPIWKDIDNRLKDLELSKYSEQYDVKEGKDGDKLRNDESIKAKLTMAEDGYGKGEVKGIIENKITIISTADNPIISFAPGDDTENSSVIKALLDVIEKIFSRFQKDENN